MRILFRPSFLSHILKYTHILREIYAKTYVSAPTILIYKINCAIKPVFIFLKYKSYLNFVLKFIILKKAVKSKIGKSQNKINKMIRKNPYIF